MVQHSAIASAGAHEPKHITSAVIGDAGKVITPSSATNGVSVLRNLVETEIDDVIDIYRVSIADISTASSGWIVAGHAGTITKIYSVIANAITGADCNITAEIGGVTVTDSLITIAFSGSAAGDVDSSTPTALNTVSAGQAIEIVSDGASSTSCLGTFTILVKRT